MSGREQYLISYDALVDISDLERIMYRIQNECDYHANALATQALDKINMIRNDIINLAGEIFSFVKENAESK